MLARLCKHALRQWPDTSPRPVTSLAVVAGDRSLVWGLKQSISRLRTHRRMFPAHQPAFKAGKQVWEPWPPCSETPRRARAHGQCQGHDRDAESCGSRLAHGLPVAPPLTPLTGLMEWPAGTGCTRNSPQLCPQARWDLQLSPMLVQAQGVLTAQSTNLCPQ